MLYNIIKRAKTISTKLLSKKLNINNIKEKYNSFLKYLFIFLEARNKNSSFIWNSSISVNYAF